MRRCNHQVVHTELIIRSSQRTEATKPTSFDRDKQLPRWGEGVETPWTPRLFGKGVFLSIIIMGGESNTAQGKETSSSQSVLCKMVRCFFCRMTKTIEGKHSPRFLQTIKYRLESSVKGSCNQEQGSQWNQAYSA